MYSEWMYSTSAYPVPTDMVWFVPGNLPPVPSSLQSDRPSRRLTWEEVHDFSFMVEWEGTRQGYGMNESLHSGWVSLCRSRKRGAGFDLREGVQNTLYTLHGECMYGGCEREREIRHG